MFRLTLHAPLSNRTQGPSALQRGPHTGGVVRCASRGGQVSWVRHVICVIQSCGVTLHGASHRMRDGQMRVIWDKLNKLPTVLVLLQGPHTACVVRCAPRGGVRSHWVPSRTSPFFHIFSPHYTSDCVWFHAHPSDVTWLWKAAKSISACIAVQNTASVNTITLEWLL